MDLAIMSSDSKPRQSSSSSRSSSRKAKNGNGAKKQPQRGLGVAQLEKLRLQEQHGKKLDHFAFSDQVPSPQVRTVRSIDSFISSLRQISQQSSMLPMQQHQQQHHLLFVHHGQQQGHPLLLPQNLMDNRQEKEKFSKDDLSASSLCFDSGNPKGTSYQDLIQAPPHGGTYGLGPPPFIDAAASMPACRQQQMGFRTPSPSKQKELSSFQNENDRGWTSDDNKAYERKRPRLEFWLRPKVVPTPNNSPDAHCYTSGVPGAAAAVSNALGKSSCSQVEKPVMLAKWLESDGYQLPEKTVAGTSLNDSATPSATTTLVNSCSSASSPSCKAIQTPRQVNGRTARSTSPSDVEIESTPLSDFLTLGFSSPTKDDDSSNSSKDHLTSNVQEEDNRQAGPAARAQIQWICINGGGATTDGCYQPTTAKRHSADVSLDLNLRLSV